MNKRKAEDKSQIQAFDYKLKIELIYVNLITMNKMTTNPKLQ